MCYLYDIIHFSFKWNVRHIIILFLLITLHLWLLRRSIILVRMCVRLKVIITC